MRALSALALGGALIIAAAAPGLAQSRGDFTLGVGVAGVLPKSDNGTLANGTLDLKIDDSIRPTITFEYFVADNIGVEVLGAWPFKHDFDLNGDRAGSTEQLPPVISVQYHFPTQTAFTPFLGVGLNYTTFFNEKARGVLSGADVSLDDSWGVAFHAGTDYKIDAKSAARFDVRWIDIDSDVRVNGTRVGKAEIDPWVVGVSYVYNF